ncbi:hypothetical protein GMMP1_300017 [Candidatus Magnetomoraceae bacterium gMMP-1]
MLLNYKIMAEIQKNSIFRWLKARELSTGNLVLLQILSADIPSDQLELLFEFFDKLMSSSKSKLFLPDDTFSDNDTQLCVVYKYIAFELFSKVILKKPKKILELFHELSEQLFYLHNRDLVHGYISPENIIVIKDEVFLINFGYAPLLQTGNELASKEVGEFRAPEVKHHNKISAVADVYAFAKTIADLYPEFKSTELYREATHNKPEKRLRRMRDLSIKLMVILPSLESSEKLIPKYSLTANAEPPEGGKIVGTGNYMSSKKIIISAIASKGYKFSHWQRDLSGKMSKASIIMDSNKEVKAVFVKNKEILNWILMILLILLGILIGGTGAYFTYYLFIKEYML